MAHRNDLDGGSTRRTFLRGATGLGVTGLAALAGCSGGEGSTATSGGGDGGGGSTTSGDATTSGSARPAFGPYLSDARLNSFVDLRGKGSVTVEVGAGADGLAFSPTRAWVDPGTTVTFEWVSAGHNVLPESTPDGSNWEGHETLQKSGYTHEHTFEAEGAYTYFCRPHEGVGMKGGIAVGDGPFSVPESPAPTRTATATRTDLPVFESYLSDARLRTYVDRTGSDRARVRVGAGEDGLGFAPTVLRVDAGTTVVFEWVSSGHNLRPERAPANTCWSGHEDLESEGFTVAHTFQVGGNYAYYCQPHVNVGMKGGIVVEGSGGANCTQSQREWIGEAKGYDGVQDARGRSTVTVEVGAGEGRLAYSPAAVRVDPGTTVVWKWVSDGHNVVAHSIPSGADWKGHDALESEGFTYEHTFETAGRYEYVCEPHEVAGMKGLLLVGDG